MDRPGNRYMESTLQNNTEQPNNRPHHLGRHWVRTLGTALLLTCAAAFVACGPGGEPWLVGPDAGDSGVADRMVDADGKAGTPWEVQPGEKVCGEPDDEVTTLAGLRDIRGCEIYRGTIELYKIKNESDGADSPLVHLQSLRVVEGDFEMAQLEPVPTLGPLAELEYVGGKFDISSIGLRAEEGLRDLSGLENLRRVEDTFAVTFCYPLKKLDGIDALRSVGRLLVSNNPVEDVSALSTLDRIRGEAAFISNPHLSKEAARSALENVTVEEGIRFQ